MIIATVPLPEDLVVPEAILTRPAMALVKTLRLLPPLGATLWLWTGMATPHRDDNLADRYLVTLSVQSRHGIGDALADAPEVPFPPGALAMIDPRTVHWLVPRETELPDDAGRITLPRWVGLRWEVAREGAAERLRELVTSLGGRWAPNIDARHAIWADRETGHAAGRVPGTDAPSTAGGGPSSGPEFRSTPRGVTAPPSVASSRPSATRAS